MAHEEEVTCSHPLCEEVAKVRGFCRTHYFRLWRYGDATHYWGASDLDLYERARRRVLSKAVIQQDGCILWTGTRISAGYGRATWFGQKRLAHRVVYEIFEGPIPDGMELDHSCGNRACVSPAHLEPVTHQENIIRGHERRGTRKVNV